MEAHRGHQRTSLAGLILVQRILPRMAGDLTAFGRGLRLHARAAGEGLEETAVWALRSDLLALDAYLRANPKASSAKVRRALDRAMELAATTHEFAAELRGFQSQKEHSEKASMFDLGAVGVLAVENVLTADKPNLARIVMSALSEALMYLASRQYVGGSAEVLRSLYRRNAASMHRDLWTLATDYRRGLSEKEIRGIQEEIDAFFRRLETDGVPVEARIAVLRQFYALLLTLRVSELLDALGE